MGDPNSIRALVNQCVELERSRLRDRSLQELARYLDELVDYCNAQELTEAGQLTPEVFRAFSILRTSDRGSAVVRCVVWSLRKFGDFVALKEHLPKSPAAALKSPKTHPRAKLPVFLSVDQLRSLLETASNRDQRDFVVLSLLASTGMRPFEVASLQRDNLKLVQHYIDHEIKGGKLKRTSLSRSMTALLSKYLSSRTDDCFAAFVSSTGKPITKSWIQRMVRDAGAKADLPFRLTCNHLRHTFATHAADRHGKTVTKALMGHRYTKTTDIYAHLSPRRFKAVMALHPYPSTLDLGITND